MAFYLRYLMDQKCVVQTAAPPQSQFGVPVPDPRPRSSSLRPASCVCKQTGGGGIRSPGSEMPARIAGRENAGTTA